MVSANILCKKLINVKDLIVEHCNFYDDKYGVHHLRVQARPAKRHINDCPYCGKSCPGYDKPAKNNKVWRGLDFGGIIVEIESSTHRIKCPEHGVVTASVPWAYPNSSFTKDLDMTATWMAKYLPISAVSKYLRIDWETVGHCIKRASHDLEADRSQRLNNLVNIGIDETSYRKGHKYITVIVNHDNNSVVWVGQGHGKSVLEEFYRSLTPEQLTSIRTVTGDGARWITDCVNEFTPDCIRCVDPFHVVEWAMEALDQVRKERLHEYGNKAEELAKEYSHKSGNNNDENINIVQKANKEAAEIKKSKYALGKNPKNLTENQRVLLEIVKARDFDLNYAHSLKEFLRAVLKFKDIDMAEYHLTKWCLWASRCGLASFEQLSEKIKRHKHHILNTIRYGLSNARVEATNNKIKLIIRKSYGFRNMGNMMDMIYLVCSNIKIPLPNRNPLSP